MLTFIAEHFFTLLGAAVGLGTGGVGFAVFGLGIPAAVMLQKAGGFIGGCVKFFSTPIGQILGAVAICALCFLAGDMRRARHDAREWDAKVAASEAAAIQRDAAIKGEVAADANARIAKLGTEKSELENKVATYAKKLEASTCHWDSGALKRLR